MRGLLWAVLGACAFADAVNHTVMHRVRTRRFPESFNAPRAAGFDEPSHSSLYIASFGAANQGPPQVARLRPLDLFTLNDTVLPSAVGTTQTPLHYAEGLAAQSSDAIMFVLHQTTPAIIARVDRQSMNTRGTLSLPEASTALCMEEDKTFLFVVAHTAPGSIFRYKKSHFDAVVVDYEHLTLDQDARWPIASTSDKNYLYVVTRPYADPNPKPAKLFQIRKETMEIVPDGKQSLCTGDMDSQWAAMTATDRQAKGTKEHWLLDNCEPLPLVSTLVSDDEHLYLITNERPGRIIKYSKQGLSSKLMRVRNATLNVGENFVRTAQVEQQPGGHLFIITNPVDKPPAVVKLNKGDLSRVGVYHFHGHERGAHASAIDSGYIYVVLASSPGAVIKISKGPNVDCAPGPWASWSACTKTCEGGSKSRSRDIVIQKAGNGKDCPAVNETQQCNTQECPVACEVGGWGPMSPCDVQTGYQTRYRKIFQEPLHGGRPCPALHKATNCTVDCAVSGWGQWSECNQRRGERYQVRNVTVTAKHGGRRCPRLHRSEHCNVDCAVSPWSDWGRCDDHSGVKQRQRRVLVMNRHYGQLCPVLSDFEDCVMHCLAGPWTTFSECRNGTAVRTRKVIKSERNGGLPCTTKQVSRCAVACEVSSWSPWSDCDKPSATRYRNRTVTKRPENAPADACPRLDELQNCDVDCEVEPWDDWSQCNDYGLQTRARSVKQYPRHDGQLCPEIFQERNCTTDCVVSNWGQYDPCSATCNGGTQTRYRDVLVEPIEATGGKACPATSESQECNKEPCICDMSAWTPWGECSATCGSGLRERTRSVVTKPDACAALDESSTVYSECVSNNCPTTKDVQSCNTDLCKVNCEMGQWGSWPETCDPEHGTHKRYRPVVTQPQAGGASCSNTEETQVCPVDCKLEDWGGWSGCVHGMRERRRGVDIPQKNDGKACEDLQEFEDCGSDDCPVGKWPSDFSICSVEGFRTRKRQLETDATGWTISREGGLEIASDGTITCLLEQKIECAVNCQMTDWGSWGTCNPKTAKKTRTREEKVKAKNGGSKCPSDTDTAVCDVDCEVSEWEKQGECNKLTGLQTRVREITNQPKHGGTACPELSNLAPCDVNCEVGLWGDWSCENKVRTRTRNIVVFPLNNGTLCPEISERMDCLGCTAEAQELLSAWGIWSDCDPAKGTRRRERTSSDPNTLCRLEDIAPCRVSCEVSDWGDYGSCNRADGLMERHRSILVQPHNGGRACPSLTDTSTCNCVLGKFGEWGPCNELTGTRTRTKEVMEWAKNGGYCPSLEERSEYVTCEVVCILSDWQTWGPCNGATGVKLRRRETIRQAHNTECGDTEQYEDCRFDCSATQWGSYSQCDTTTGLKERHRSIIHDSKNGGSPCTLHEQVTCPVHCIMSNWTDWEPCDFETYTQTRQRTIEVVPRHGGTPCPTNSEQRECQMPTPAPTPVPERGVPTPPPAYASVRVAQYDYTVTVQLVTLTKQRDNGLHDLRDYDVISTIDDVKSLVQRAMVVYAHLSFDNDAEVRCISGCEENRPAASMHFSVELMAPNVQRAMLIRQALKATNAAFRFKETLKQVYFERTQQNYDSDLNIKLDEAQVVGTINPKDRVELVQNTTQNGEMYTKVLSAELYLANVNIPTFDATARRIFKHVLKSDTFLNVEWQQIILWQIASGDAISGSMYVRINVTTTPEEEERVAYKFQLLVADPRDFGSELHKEYTRAYSAPELQNIDVVASSDHPGIDLTDLKTAGKTGGETEGATEVETFNDEVKAEKAQSPAEKMRAQLVYVAGGFLFVALVIFVIALVVRYRKRRLEKNAFFGELEAEYDQENLLDDGDWAALGDFGNENFAETNPMYKMNNQL